jgi:hypothetical protein
MSSPGRRPRKSGTRRRIVNDPEHELQASLVAWAEIAQGRLHELALLHAIPNGGARGIRTAVRMREEGQLAGVWDLFLPVPRSAAHGLYLETKVDTRLPDLATGRLRRYHSRLSVDQIIFGRAVAANGYAARVYRTLDEGRDILNAYLENRLELTVDPELWEKP